MSLQVWLPFVDGTLANNGFTSLTLSSSNTSVQNNGKLGKCLAFNGTSSIITSTEKVGIIGDTSYTIAFWMYWAGDTWTNDYVGIVGWGQMGTNQGAWAIIHNGKPDLDFWNRRYEAKTQLQVKRWYHIAMVKTPGDMSTTSKLYVDGLEVAGTPSSTETPSIVDGTLLIGRLNNSSTRWFNGYLNDIRIYDEALSPFEIKRISQGLILHYPLSDVFLENTTNLITTEDCLSSTCYNASTSKYGYGTNTDIYKTVTTFEGRKGTKVYMGTNGNNCYPYVYVNGMYTSNGTNSPEYKTLSFDYYTTVSTSICPYKLGSGTGTATYIVNANGIERTGTGTNSVVIPIIPNTWNHVEVTFHGTTDADAQWGYIQNQPAHVSNTNNFWFFANMQLEAKDHATGYAGVGGSRTINNMVYDNSGFCNNGISNNIIISNDTPKYKYSSIFNGTNSYIKVDNNNWMIKGMSEMTVNLWAKASTWPASGGRLISCTETGGFNIEGGNSGYWRFPVFVYTNSEQSSSAYKYDSNEIKIADLISDEWNMITLIYDNTGTKTYINGELHHNYVNTSYGINFNTNARLFLGCEANTASPTGPYFNGKECDFRIYATALSADDVKALYEDSAYIATDGTAYAYEFVEE